MMQQGSILKFDVMPQPLSFVATAMGQIEKAHDWFCPIFIPIVRSRLNRHFIRTSFE